MQPRRPRIGVFDSGLGGLTVARAIRDALPGAHILYLGDEARIPYGTRSAHTVQRYAAACVKELASRDIDFLVVACNTVSAVALEDLRTQVSVPVVGVIEPAARAALAASASARVGIIATQGTASSGAYASAIGTLNAQAAVHTQACPLLVPLVEEDWLTGPVPEAVVARYLSELGAKGAFDTLILGCTHYPLLTPTIRRVLETQGSGHVHIVDSATGTALETARLIGAQVPSDDGGKMHILVTDLPRSFERIALKFLGPASRGFTLEGIDLQAG